MFNTEDLYDEVGIQLLARRGKVFTPQLKDAMMGRPARVALQIMIDWHELDDSVEELQAHTDDIFAEILPKRLAPMPGLLELLDTLESTGIPKAIATSSRREFTRRVLGQFELESRFEFLLTAEDVNEGKPHPEIYQAAAQRFARRPPELLVLEDSENGCRAAVAAGMYTVAIPGRHSRNHNFDGVAFVADSLADPRIHDLLRR